MRVCAVFIMAMGGVVTAHVGLTVAVVVLVILVSGVIDAVLQEAASVGGWIVYCVFAG